MENLQELFLMSHVGNKTLNLSGQLAKQLRPEEQLRDV
jgi:hypothetical protein